jgi:hypothetical protein
MSYARSEQALEPAARRVEADVHPGLLHRLVRARNRDPPPPAPRPHTRTHRARPGPRLLGCRLSRLEIATLTRTLRRTPSAAWRRSAGRSSW